MQDDITGRIEGHTEADAPQQGERERDELVAELTTRFLNKALEAELETHLGYGKHTHSKSGNTRNGYYTKSLQMDAQEIVVNVPRDRNGTFSTKIIEKHEKRIRVNGEALIELYSGKLKPQDIQDCIEEIYGKNSPPDLICNVAKAIQEDINEWSKGRAKN